MLKKYSGNPILRSDSVKFPWANLKVYNSGMIFDNGVYHMFFRAIGSEDFISRIGHGKSIDGIHFEIDPKPVLSPKESFETHGCEDPRITKIGNIYYMTYTAFEGRTGRAAIISSQDFNNWGKRRLLLSNWHGSRWNTKVGRPIQLPNFNTSTWDQEKDSNWSKAAAIFSEKINGKYMLLFGDDSIWSATSDDLIDWKINPEPIISPREGYFDQGYVEMGPPPFKTEEGWLIFYHGINRLDNQRVYCIAAAILDLVDPTKILWRSSKPLIEPKEPYEVLGMIDIMDGGWDKLKTITPPEIQKLAEEKKLPKAVFCSGAIETNTKPNHSYNLYYSGADTVLCLASGTLEDIKRE